MCPRAAVFSENAGPIELLGDFAFRLLVGDKPCVKLLRAIMNSNAGALQDILVVGALGYVLEPSPTAHVIDETR